MIKGICHCCVLKVLASKPLFIRLNKAHNCLLMWFPFKDQDNHREFMQPWHLWGCFPITRSLLAWLFCPSLQFVHRTSDHKEHTCFIDYPEKSFTTIPTALTLAWMIGAKQATCCRWSFPLGGITVAVSKLSFISECSPLLPLLYI